MRKFKYLIIVVMFLIPCMVKAYTREDIEMSFDVCKEGCQYNNLADIFTYMYNYVSMDEMCLVESATNPKVAHFYNVTINIKDNGEYNLNNPNGWFYECGEMVGGGVTVYKTRDDVIENLTINGNGNIINYISSPDIGGTFHFDNLVFKSVKESNGQNSYILINSASSYKQKDRDDLSTSTIDNCDLSAIDLVVSGNQNVNITNTKLKNVSAMSSKVSKYFLSNGNEKTNVNTYMVINNPTFVNNAFSRVSEFPSDNTKSYLKTNCIEEGVCSKITVYKNDKKTINFTKGEEISVAKLIDSELVSDATVETSNSSILEYKNGKLIPLKTGVVNVTISNGEDHYNYRIILTKVNPKTANKVVVSPDTALQKGRKLMIIGILFTIVGISMQLIIFKKVIK